MSASCRAGRARAGRHGPGRALAALAAGLLLAACSQSGLLTRQDYAASERALARGRPAEALADFPKGERGTFITTMERTYLGLLQGQADIDALLPYERVIDDRVRFDASREVHAFFYAETPEGYYASEHEIVWMHMLLSWGYSLRGQREDACVEARQAAQLLTARWSDVGHFDDPMLRTILAALWAWCGSWEDAQVDLRVAAQLDPSLDWARALGGRVAPPRNLFLVLGGVGPEPYWEPKLELNPLRGVRAIGFRFRGQHSPLGVETYTQIVTLHRTPDAAPWYARHIVRDNAIHDLIADSRYGAESAYESGVMATRYAAAGAFFAGAVAVGVTGGAAIWYVTFKYATGEAVAYGFAAGLAVPIAAVNYGQKEYNRMTAEARERFRSKTDPSPYYRYVRFLPEYAWLGWSDEPLDSRPWATRSDGLESEVLSPLTELGGRGPRVFLGFAPDVPAPDTKPGAEPGPAR
jgi:hypothetical protein